MEGGRMKGLEEGDDFVCRSITGCSPSDVDGLCAWLAANVPGHVYPSQLIDVRRMYRILKHRETLPETVVQILDIRLRYLKEQILKNKPGRAIGWRK